MKEKENTANPTSRKKLIYSIVIAVCALLLIAATVLTVYFVTNGTREIAEKPPVQEDPGKEDPGKNPPQEDPGKEEPEKKPDDTPTGGQKVAYVKPLDAATCTVEYEEIYNNVSTDKWYRHMAVDYAASEGAPVFAMADGKVQKISMEEILGNYIILEHEGGITTLYRFVAPISGLKEGDTVKQGQTIATVDKAFGTEYKDGTHLHLEMKLDGEWVDPMDYIDVALEEK